METANTENSPMMKIRLCNRTVARDCDSTFGTKSAFLALFELLNETKARGKRIDFAVESKSVLIVARLIRRGSIGARWLR